MPNERPAEESVIREQAYYFWEEEGRPSGRETEFWMRAVVAVTEKTQLKTLTQSPPKAAKSKAAAKPPEKTLSTAKAKLSVPVKTEAAGPKTKGEKPKKK